MNGWHVDIAIDRAVYNRARRKTDPDLSARQTIIDLFLAACDEKHKDRPRETVKWGSLFTLGPVPRYRPVPGPKPRPTPPGQTELFPRPPRR